MVGGARPKKISVLVAQNIVRDIRRGNLQPGHLLPPERVMLETYDIGRGTLREALRLLEFQGVIALKPGPKGGPIVLEPDATHLADSLLLLMELREAPYGVVVEMRSILEPEACRMAALRMDDDGREKLRQNILTMREKLEDEHTFLQANKEFHDLIAWASGNPLLGYFTESITGIMDGTVMDVDYPLPRRKAVLAVHEEIADSILARDGERAYKLMDDHLKAYVEFSRRRYPELLDRPLQWGPPRM